MYYPLSLLVFITLSWSGQHSVRFCHVSKPDHTNNSVVSFDIEMAQSFLTHIKKNFEAVEIKWESIFQYNNRGEPLLFSTNRCEFLAASLTASAERKRHFDIVSIYPGRTMVVVRKENLNLYRSISDLRNKIAAAHPNTTYYETLKKINRSFSPKDKISIKISSPQNSSKHQLITGDVDFILLDTADAFAFIKQAGGKVVMAFPASPNEQIGWAFSKTAPRLKTAFKQYYNASKNNPNSIVNKIFLKHFGVNAKKFDDIVFSSMGVDE